ncbi:MAG: hypothetical protein LLG16_02265 [Euryarchaeota archaeon]|nr:hypothetical protein [Euryarchaeota archaeon]
MKWKSHAAVTRAVCRAVGMSDYHERIIIGGAIEPDLHPVNVRRGSDMPGRVAHHGRSDRVINILLWKSRLAFIRGDEEHGCRNLGRALHYVQDKSVSFGRNLSSHDRLEEEIGEMSVPEMAIEIGLDNALCSPIYVSECVRSIEPKRDAYDAIYQATYVSAALTSAVVGTTEATPDLGRELRRAVILHHYVLSPLAFASAFIVVALALISGHLELSALAPVMIGAALVSEWRYRSARKVAQWYGIE